VDAGRTVVLATVVATRGSTPRGAGSKMLIEADGTLVGTIGGGCGEGEVIAAARDVASTGQPRMLRVDLTDDTDGWSAAICGGVMEIVLEAVGTADDR
jgi:xanthine/CO dehydrogenase XdhC/CoxF family maturation factor